jgi:hypothetical protein
LSVAFAAALQRNAVVDHVALAMLRVATTKSLRLTVAVEVAPEGGVSKQSVEETRTALRELGLKDVLQ